jgi:hypothetical protein
MHAKKSVRERAYVIGQLKDFLQWLVIVLEATLNIRFFLKLIGADPHNLFVGFIYALTDIFLFPFLGIVHSPQLQGDQVFEWSTLISMIVYWLIFWATRHFLLIIDSGVKIHNPTLDNADANLRPLPGADRFIGPRRTFGGILRIPCNVRYLSGEYTVRYIQRSRYVLWRNWLLLFALLLVAMPLTPQLGFIPANLQSSWWFMMGLTVVGILIAMLLIYMSYINDVFILTNMRIIDIERYFVFFFEAHVEIEYKNIRNIKVKTQSILQRILNIGNVYIETPGSNPDIIMFNVNNPFALQDEILDIRAHKERANDVKKENEEKEV